MSWNLPRRGYFVSPPGGLHHEPTVNEEPPDDVDTSEHDRERDLEEKRRINDDERRRRLEREREVASNGETEWVRSGGILRDACGRRDYARTESIRAELRLQAEEQRVMARWEAYEGAWRRLLASTGPVAFADIPWPVQHAPCTVAELTPAAIANFLLASLSVRANCVTRKERVRGSLLRWHPDKIFAVLNRVVGDDAGAVREGVSTVLMCLKAL